MTQQWRPDVLPGFEASDLEIIGSRAPGEEVDPVATLVRTVVPGRAAGTGTAVLYVHGWNDYFFQSHLADFWVERGWRFHALDLRRYGRSLRPTQLHGFVTDLSEYDEELGAAMDVITAEHDQVVLMGHSTGGLIASLWASTYHERIAGVVLNSPWLELQGSAMVRALGTPVIDAVGVRNATAIIRLPDAGLYARALHVSQEGEWDYDTALKTSPSPPIRTGWLRAVRHGHQQVAKGLGIEAPVLVMCSDRTAFRRRWSEELRSVDSVLDVEQIAARAPKLGQCVTIVRIPGGMHDLVLSAPDVRARAFAEIDRWSHGYLPQPQPAAASAATNG